ncbi:MAG: membrane protein insertase YidC [Candidatus Hydrogenedens sp.]|nr:membrane protein insertase YidC [Candidatus Hydrogenedens sp.]
MQRNQLLAIVLMTILVFVWTYFFLPSAPPPSGPGEYETAQSEGERAQPGLFEQSTDSRSAVPVETSPVTDEKEVEAEGAPVIPPVATAPEDPADDEIALSNSRLDLVFTRVGARLKKATVLLGAEGKDSIQLVPEAVLPGDGENVYPLSMLFSDPQLGDKLNYCRWELAESSEAQTLVFQLDIPGYVFLEKTFSLAPDSYVLETGIRYQNLGQSTRLLGLDRKEPALSLYWGPNVSSGDLTKGSQQNIVLHQEGKNSFYATSKLKPVPGASWYNERVLDTEWASISSAYFTVAVKPEFEFSDSWYYGDKDYFRLGQGAPRREILPGEFADFNYSVYVGPRSSQYLVQAWPGLDSVFSFFTSFTIMDRFAKLLLAILVWFHDHIIANYGLAIIFLTVLVRMIMFPLTWKSMISMKRMSMLAPEMEKLKAECGEDQQELQKRMMALYKERGVSPLGGCLPMLLQMPVFIALYRMLWSAFELRRAPFIFWIQDLSEADRLLTLPFSIPLPLSSVPLDSLNLLPILMAASMVISQKMMPMSEPAQNQQQKMMMTFMPVFFGFITYNMASGLNLYIFVSTLLGIAQNYFVRGIKVDAAPVKAKKPARRRHFYDEARLKQREISKEVRKQKQRSRRRKK